MSELVQLAVVVFFGRCEVRWKSRLSACLSFVCDVLSNLLICLPSAVV